jgi:GNAT superfamily N-acetyltransferase
MVENDLIIVYISSNILNEVEEKITFDDKTFSKHRDRLHLQESGKGQYLIAFLNKFPVGHVFIRWEGAEDSYVKTNIKNCPNIEDLFVNPKFRSLGIGSKLIDKCIKLAKEKGFFQIGLGVEVTNVMAVGLYSRFNFEEANINPYKDIWFGEDKKGSKTGPFSAKVKYFILGFH